MLLLCVLPVISQVAAEGVESTAEMPANLSLRQVQQLALSLAQSQDARELALAALLADRAPIVAFNGKTPEDLRREALALAADDVLVLPMLIAFNRFPKAQTLPFISEVAQRWQQLEADNLAPLLYQTELSMEQLLDKAKTKKHFELHFYAARRWMYQTLLKYLPASTLAEQSALLNQLAVISLNTALPSLSGLMAFCEAKDKAPNHSEQCQWVAQVLSGQSTNLSAQTTGLAISLSLPQGQAKQKILKQQLRRNLWLLQQRLKTLSAENLLYSLQNPAINGEQEEVENLLLREGLPLAPDSTN